jgi:hypothetical protein
MRIWPMRKKSVARRSTLLTLILESRIPVATDARRPEMATGAFWTQAATAG